MNESIICRHTIIHQSNAEEKSEDVYREYMKIDEVYVDDILPDVFTGQIGILEILDEDNRVIDMLYGFENEHDMVAFKLVCENISDQAF